MKNLEKTSSTYFVGGINGSGKSTLLKKIAKEDKRFKIIHGSEYLMKHLGIKNGDYEALRSTSDYKKELAKEQIAKEVTSQKNSGETVLFDAHYIKIYNGKIYSAIEGNWISLFQKLFFVKSDPKEILSRIENDTKDRKLFSYNHVTEEEKIKFLSECSSRAIDSMEKAGKKFKIPTFTVNNKEGNIDKCVEDFLNINKIIN